ncbi:syndecan-1-like [Trichomycterus rosablanca]|uniref:syndecan-1-like n=1 Tax=Trichomycterus rosablanca TaxID=2290929 RepID=UPI002F35C29A
MKIHLGVPVLVFLCLWIPVAQSQDATAPEDQDASGDDGEFSGSGSGEMVFKDPTDDFELATEATPNTSVTDIPDVPVKLPVHPVTQPSSTVPPEADPGTPELAHLAPLLPTTQIPETISPTTVQSVTPFDLGQEPEVDETTAAPDATPTTVPSADKLPVPTTKEELMTTLSEDVKMETTASVLLGEYEDETTVSYYGDYTEELGTTGLALITTASSDPADPEASGDDVFKTTQATVEDNFLEENIIPDVHPKTEVKKEVEEDDFVIENDNEIRHKGRSSATLADDENLLERKEVLAGVIAGGVVGLAFAVMLVALMVYRMKKKDEGSYSLDEHKHPNGGYQKPQRQEEFLA